MGGRARLVGAALALLVVAGGCAQASAEDPAPPNRRDQLEAGAPTILEPALGAEVTSPFTVRIDPGPIDPTGDTVPVDAGGRFHLLVDQGCLDNAEQFPPVDATHVAFEQGALEAEVELTPGAHELCLQFGNVYDVAFYATDTVTIRVVG